MELGQLQAQDQSHWPHWLLEHCNHVSRWFSMCLRWQGCQSHVVGPQWWQTLVHLGPRRHHQRFVLLSQPLLVVRRHRPIHQDLGSWKQEHGWRAQTRGPWKLFQGWTTPMFVYGLVSWWPNSFRWLLWQPNPCLAGLHLLYPLNKYELLSAIVLCAILMTWLRSSVPSCVGDQINQ